MGFIARLFGRDVAQPPRTPKVVFASSEAMRSAIVKRARARSGSAALVIVHSLDTTAVELRAAFAAAGVPLHEWAGIPSQLDAGGTWLLSAQIVLGPSGLPEFLKRHDDADVVLAELPTTVEQETAIVAKIVSLGAKPLAATYAALDQPLFDAFGGDRLRALMQTLGMAPGEPIEHPMVDRAIDNARAKAARK